MEQSSITRYIVRHTYLAQAVGLATAALLIFVIGTVPLFQKSRTLSADVTAKREEARQLADKVTLLKGIDQNVLDERVTALDNALPPRKDVILYLTAVQGLSQQLNLNFGGVSLAPGNVVANLEATKGLQTLDTSIKITGTQDSIYTFLKLIEQSAPLMQIKDAKVSQDTNGSFSLALNLGMLWAASDPGTVKGQIELFDEKEENYFQMLAGYRRYSPVTSEPSMPDGVGKNNLFEKFTP